MNRKDFKRFIENGAAAQRAVNALMLCQVKSSQCNGQDVVQVQMRLAKRTDAYEDVPKLCCAGCRKANWGAFRYLRGPFQQELSTK